VLEANPTRLFRLLAAQPGLGAALVAAAVAEAADAAEAEASKHAGGGGGAGGGEEPGELWLLTLLDALLARLRRPEGRPSRADVEGVLPSGHARGRAGRADGRP
jgi:hypothetical protein